MGSGMDSDLTMAAEALVGLAYGTYSLPSISTVRWSGWTIACMHAYLPAPNGATAAVTPPCPRRATPRKIRIVRQARCPPWEIAVALDCSP